MHFVFVYSLFSYPMNITLHRPGLRSISNTLPMKLHVHSEPYNKYNINISTITKLEEIAAVLIELYNII